MGCLLLPSLHLTPEVVPCPVRDTFFLTVLSSKVLEFLACPLTGQCEVTVFLSWAFPDHPAGTLECPCVPTAVIE